MKNRNLFWGLFFLISALFIILSQTWLFTGISTIGILTTVLLATLIVNSLIKRNFFFIFIPVGFLYMIYSKPFKLMYISPWLIISSAVLISIGFTLLFSRGHKKAAFLHSISDQFNEINENTEDSYPYAKVVLNSASKYIHSECLKGGHFISYLGVLEVYFDHAELSTDGAKLFIDCVLGSIYLYVPRDWNVVDNIHSYLGDVDLGIGHNKFSKNAPQLTLAGKVTLGDVHIFYI